MNLSSLVLFSTNTVISYILKSLLLIVDTLSIIKLLAVALAIISNKLSSAFVYTNRSVANFLVVESFHFTFINLSSKSIIFLQLLL